MGRVRGVTLRSIPAVDRAITSLTRKRKKLEEELAHIRGILAALGAAVGRGKGIRAQSTRQYKLNCLGCGKAFKSLKVYAMYCHAPCKSQRFEKSERAAHKAAWRAWYEKKFGKRPGKKVGGKGNSKPSSERSPKGEVIVKGDPLTAGH